MNVEEYEEYLHLLNPKDAGVLRHCFGLQGEPMISQAELARRWGVTRKTVNARKIRALRTLAQLVSAGTTLRDEDPIERVVAFQSQQLRDLKRQGVTTVKQLRAMDRKALLRLHRISYVTAQRILDELEERAG